MARVLVLIALIAIACASLFAVTAAAAIDAADEVTNNILNKKGRVGGRRASNDVDGMDAILPPEVEYDEMGRPKPPTFARHTFEVPSFLHRVKQNDLIRLQKKFDILAVFVGHPLYCPAHCTAYYNMFVETAKTFLADVGGHNKVLLGGNKTEDVVKFCFLDVEKEGDEYVDAVGGDTYSGHDFPQVLIMKAQHQLVARKPPISLAVNDQLPFRLPKFLLRVAGDSPAKVTSEEELMPRISHKATERVSIGLWMDTVPRSLREVIFEERFQYLFHQLPSPDKAELTLWQKYNPNKADIVMYYYKRPGFNMKHINESTTIESVMTMDHVSFNKTISGERRIHDHQHRLFTRALALWGKLQPGREFDDIKRITIQNSSAVPENCDDRRVATGDRFVARVVGRLARNGRPFADSREDTFVAGDTKRVDTPNYIMSHGFLGMCAGMKRRVAFPPNRAWPADIRPSAVGERDIVVYHIHLLQFLDEGEVGPDNRVPAVEDYNDPEGEL